LLLGVIRGEDGKGRCKVIDYVRGGVVLVIGKKKKIKESENYKKKKGELGSDEKIRA
jgi:hypothetical protein